MPPLSKVTSQGAKNRHLNGTSNYIAEYIVMLVSLTALATSVILMAFSVCALLKHGNTSAMSTASGLSAVVAFLVFGPLYYVLNSRVRAQEINEPATVKHKARTVFYVFASIAAFGWFTGFVITSVYYLLSPLVTKNVSYGDNLVTVFIPAVIGATVVAVSYMSIAKAAATKYVTKFASIMLLAGLVLAIVTLSVSIAKKNSKPTLKTNETCTYANYKDGKCTYDEYQDYVDGLYRTPTTDYDRYNTQNNLNSLYDL